jgi:hypothetical protein
MWPSAERRAGLLLAGLGLAPALATAGSDPASDVAVTLSGYLDEAGSYATDAALDIPVGAGFAVTGNVGYSSLEAEFRLPAAGNRDLSFAYGGLGLRYARGGFSAGLDGSSWGDKDLARTRDFRARAGYDWARFGVYATAVTREVEARVRRLEAVTIVTESRSQDVTGWGGGVQLGLRDNWWLYASGEDQQYDRKFPGVLRLRSGGVVGQRLLTLTSIFPDWVWSVGTDVEFGRHRLNLEYLADRSIFGALDTRTTSAAWRLPLGAGSDHFLDVRVGVSNADASDSQSFGILTYTGFW